ncbi:MAG: RIP metalloprotease RseP [Bacteroidia bacterium]
MTVIIMIAQMLLGLSLLVLLHEWGHFAAARAFKIKVEKFYVFFDAWGKKLFSIKRGDTEYGIGWLPLGGYVKISGMVDESLDTAQLKSAPQDHEFRSKPAWQRLVVMLGGVTVNALLGVVIFSGMLIYWGEKYIPNTALEDGIAASELAQELGFETGDKLISINGVEIVRFDEIVSSKVLLGENTRIGIQRGTEAMEIILPQNFTRRILDSDDKSVFVSPRLRFSVGEVIKGMPAEEAGFMAGDRIIDINGIPISYFDELQSQLKTVSGQTADIAVLRDEETIMLSVAVSEQGTIGFYPVTEPLAIGFKKYSFLAAIPAGANMAWRVVADNVKGFGKVFSGDIPVEKSIGGPIAIAKKMYGGEWQWYRFWMTTGLLSMILAFMNLLPIPALDGGHVMFLLIEMVIRRPLGEKVMLAAQYVGMVIVIALMIFAFGNDIWQHILK